VSGIGARHEKTDKTGQAEKGSFWGGKKKGPQLAEQHENGEGNLRSSRRAERKEIVRKYWRGQKRKARGVSPVRKKWVHNNTRACTARYKLRSLKYSQKPERGEVVGQEGRGVTKCRLIGKRNKEELTGRIVLRQSGRTGSNEIWGGFQDAERRSYWKYMRAVKRLGRRENVDRGSRRKWEIRKVPSSSSRG